MNNILKPGSAGALNSGSCTLTMEIKKRINRELPFSNQEHKCKIVEVTFVLETKNQQFLQLTH